ncbi:calcium/sodium antiporter [Hyphococcus flavus]|uniref:Calcium/sodium antiporter n=1 Tax=Hyphococcus flavus TaxID=1866326 RepID=A0AAF0CG07_9PROT|nr:calcium/sodium antiporter [Hyphococcus flavus]WDI31663.1 calcium/sodium antiporter [Hyphococcus flavus]
MSWLFVLAGLVILTLGAEALIRGATGLARRFGLSELLIGLTLVGFGTSTPELVSSVQAALSGAPGIAVGNVVGSNIANILFILGISAAIAPIAIEPKSFRRDMPALLGATVIAIAIMMMGEIGRLAGAGFLLLLALYIGYAYVTESRATSAPEPIRHEAEAAQLAGAQSSFLAIFLCFGGLALLVVGAKLLVSGAIMVAGAFGVSEAIIGLTIVAVGTSLPELVTSVMAAVRGKSDLALGNVVGSNLYNLLGILGATALVKPLTISVEILRFDVWVMLAATGAMALFAMTKHRIERWEGAVLFISYGAYIAYLAVTA